MTIDEMREKCERLGVGIGFSENTDVFKRKITVNNTVVKNVVVILPMEGNDSEQSGAPSDLTFRRYRRFARGGAAFIWAEAIAVEKSGRASTHQLYLDEQTLPAFAELCRTIKTEGMEVNGYEPVVIAQITHSGRYSNTDGSPKPVIAARNPWLDKKYRISDSHRPISDEELIVLEQSFLHTASLAKHAGFDGVDIKMCHGYLLNELLSAHTRTGEYGGTYEKRTRFAKNVVKSIRASAGKNFIIGSRVSLFDAMPYPYGFGMKRDGSFESDLTEPVKLLTELKVIGLNISAVTLGNPYYNPHLSRPFDHGAYDPPEPGIKGVERLINLAREAKKSTEGIVFVGAGYSYLREMGPYAAAHALINGDVDMIGFGRQAFAYPDFAADIFGTGGLDGRKVCIACSKCSEIMRCGGPTGCVVRDDLYRDIYKKYCKS